MEVRYYCSTLHIYHLILCILVLDPLNLLDDIQTNQQRQTDNVYQFYLLVYDDGKMRNIDLLRRYLNDSTLINDTFTEGSTNQVSIEHYQSIVYLFLLLQQTIRDFRKATQNNWKRQMRSQSNVFSMVTLTMMILLEDYLNIRHY